ncbi:hypothetical protein BN979_05106 [Mycolicibacterium vulneris]|nr:hypothetical protein BN979_05106 [Mycolicibacterium vulneris]
MLRSLAHFFSGGQGLFGPWSSLKTAKAANNSGLDEIDVAVEHGVLILIALVGVM